MTLEDRRAARKAAALAVYADCLAAGFVADGHTWSISGEEREILTAGIAIAAIDASKLPALFGVIDRDGAIVQITSVAQGLALLAALLQFEMSLRLRLWTLYRDIAATDNPEVIDINAEWPAKP